MMMTRIFRVQTSSSTIINSSIIILIIIVIIIIIIIIVIIIIPIMIIAFGRELPVYISWQKSSQTFVLCTRLAQARTRRIGLIDSFLGLRTKIYESCQNREGSLYLAADVIVQASQI